MKVILFILLFILSISAPAQVVKHYDWQAWEKFFTNRTDNFMDAFVDKGILDKPTGDHYRLIVPVKEMWLDNGLEFYALEVMPDSLYLVAGKDYYAFSGEEAIDADTLWYYEIMFSEPMRFEHKIAKKNGELKIKIGKDKGFYLKKEVREKKLKEKKAKEIKVVISPPSEIQKDKDK